MRVVLHPEVEREYTAALEAPAKPACQRSGSSQITPVMPTAVRRKPARHRKVAKSAKFALSKAGLARNNGARDTIEPIPFRPVGTLPVTDRELALDTLAGPDVAPESRR